MKLWRNDNARWQVVVLVTALLCLNTNLAWAAEHRYTVRAGDTLAQISRHYYGAAWKAVYIEARNSLGEGRIRPGQTLVIPASWTYTVRAGDTLAKIAQRYLGATHRYTRLMEENGLRAASQLSVGSTLLMPFHLRHPVQRGESFSGLGQRYYRSSRRGESVRVYNQLGTLRPDQRLVIPIFDRNTVGVKRRPLAAATPRAGYRSAATGPSPATSATARPQKRRLELALEQYRIGRFDPACATLETLLGEAQLASADRTIVIKHLAFCAVAHNDLGAAEEYVRKWLELEPNPTLDPAKISPKLIEVVKQASRP